MKYFYFLLQTVFFKKNPFFITFSHFYPSVVFIQRKNLLHHVIKLASIQNRIWRLFPYENNFFLPDPCVPYNLFNYISGNSTVIYKYEFCGKKSKHNWEMFEGGSGRHILPSFAFYIKRGAHGASFRGEIMLRCVCPSTLISHSGVDTAIMSIPSCRPSYSPYFKTGRLPVMT